MLVQVPSHGERQNCHAKLQRHVMVHDVCTPSLTQRQLLGEASQAHFDRDAVLDRSPGGAVIWRRQRPPECSRRTSSLRRGRSTPLLCEHNMPP